MGVSPTPPSAQQSTLVLTTAAAVVGVLAGVLLTLGYGDAVAALVTSRKSPSTGTSDVVLDCRERADREGNWQKKSGRMGLEDEGSGKVDGGIEGKRNVKEGIEGCIGNTPLIRIVSQGCAVRA